MPNDIDTRFNTSGRGGPPTIPPKVRTGGNDDGDDNPTRNTTNSQQAQPKSENKELNLLRQISNWTGILVTIPTGAISGLTGILSFLGANTSLDTDDRIETIANVSSRLAFFSYGLGGALTNYDNKNIFGTAGYAFNLFVAPFASKDAIYPLTGLTSALDSMPLTAEVISESKNCVHIQEKLKEKYSEQYKNPNFRFTEFKTWEDGLKRTMDASIISIKEMKNNFDTKNILKSTTELFKRPEFNLITSTCGYFGAFGVYCLTPFKLAGEIGRDIIGLQSDVGVMLGGLEGVVEKLPWNEYTRAGKWTRAGDLSYATAGPPYIIGSLIDLFYRIKPLENLEQAALGVDRLGAACMAAANIFHDAGKKEAAIKGEGFYTAA